MQRVLAQVDRVAASETRVCILGETGTGKELVARAIHDRSGPARAAPFVTLNCAAVPAELIESELFGHEKGSFTGAGGAACGQVRASRTAARCFWTRSATCRCDAGQAAARVWRREKWSAWAGDKPITVDVRVVVATHRNLEELIKRNEFRSDLYHRVYVFPLALPPLRERLEDFSELVEHFSKQVAKQNGWKEKVFSEEAIAELRHYSWPGNVRELRNIVERLALLAMEETVTPEAVRLALPTNDSSSALTNIRVGEGHGTLVERTEAFERDVLLAEIRRHNFHMTNVAKALGLERSHLYKKCQQLGIDLSELRKPE